MSEHINHLRKISGNWSAFGSRAGRHASAHRYRPLFNAYGVDRHGPMRTFPPWGPCDDVLEFLAATKTALKREH